MENVYHSHENLLPDTKRQNIVKKSISACRANCMQNNLAISQTNPYLLSKARLKNRQQMTPKKRAQMQAPSLGGRVFQGNALKLQGTLIECLNNRNRVS
jgi:hypothetical protein